VTVSVEVVLVDDHVDLVLVAADAEEMHGFGEDLGGRGGTSKVMLLSPASKRPNMLRRWLSSSNYSDSLFYIFDFLYYYHIPEGRVKTIFYIWKLYLNTTVRYHLRIVRATKEWKRSMRHPRYRSLCF
jgi:hypothetical protein